MPTYDYYCPVCHAQTSVVKSIHTDSQEMCVNCNVPLMRSFSVPPVSFKGTGWGHQ